VHGLVKQQGAAVIEYLLLVGISAILLISNIDTLKSNLVSLNSDLASKAKSLASDVSI
jgi:Flp pilus assembly pilin Flp